MINEPACQAISIFLHFGCNIFHLFPYTWNPVKFQLENPPKSHLRFYKVHFFLNYMDAAFILSRSVKSQITWSYMPQHLRSLNWIWVFAYGLSSFSYFQYEYNRQEILEFANSLFAYIRRTKGKVYNYKLMLTFCKRKYLTWLIK